MSSEIESIELHDANLRSISVDCAQKQVKLLLSVFVDITDRARKDVEICFDDVESFSSTVDLARMKKNSFAGNVNYWIVGDERSPTYIYLTDGLIAISSKQPRLSLS